MTIYFLRDKLTGDYYVRRGEWTKSPVGAAVWTTPGGPQSAKGAITRKNQRYPRCIKHREPEVVTIKCPEPKDPE
ncbi:MAG: hypothetical protein ACYS7Y_03950 [Planctomycetota bacterium]|jgi:hypothetical protein